MALAAGPVATITEVIEATGITDGGLAVPGYHLFRPMSPVLRSLRPPAAGGVGAVAAGFATRRKWIATDSFQNISHATSGQPMPGRSTIIYLGKIGH